MCRALTWGHVTSPQPNILDEYVKERGLAPAAASGKLTGPEDLLILEDEKARMVLRGADLPIASLVTGAPRPPGRMRALGSLRASTHSVYSVVHRSVGASSLWGAQSSEGCTCPGMSRQIQGPCCASTKTPSA